MSNLWSQNTPERFWSCDPPVAEVDWREALPKALPLLDLANVTEVDELLASTLGEARFGPDHWRLSLSKRLYYVLKPILPRPLTRFLRRHYNDPFTSAGADHWPVDSRYATFQWELMRQILAADGRSAKTCRRFWPDGCRFAFVLTHDVETAEGQAFVREVADLEEGLGFRSSFNFVPERYSLDIGLIQNLRERGFEVGCHGLKHDGKLFSTRAGFAKRAAKINAHLKEYKMVGFRAPLTHRHPEWMQALEIDYDLSFFDTDPFEPIPGGAMSIWPFFIGRFVELPYTLVQDYTLTSVLGETSPRIWLEKVDFLEKYHGMALVNSHPDYLKTKNTWDVYREFLLRMKQRDGYWQALPHEVANWWRRRNADDAHHWKAQGGLATVSLKSGELEISD